MNKDIPSFPDYASACGWMETEVNDPYIDNHRFAYVSDKHAMKLYRIKRSKGCCGSFDQEILVKGRKAMIGCNYGH